MPAGTSSVHPAELNASCDAATQTKQPRGPENPTTGIEVRWVGKTPPNLQRNGDFPGAYFGGLYHRFTPLGEIG